MSVTKKKLIIGGVAAALVIGGGIAYSNHAAEQAQQACRTAMSAYGFASSKTAEAQDLADRALTRAQNTPNYKAEDLAALKAAIAMPAESPAMNCDNTSKLEKAATQHDERNAALKRESSATFTKVQETRKANDDARIEAARKPLAEALQGYKAEAERGRAVGYPMEQVDGTIRMWEGFLQRRDEDVDKQVRDLEEEANNCRTATANLKKNIEDWAKAQGKQLAKDKARDNYTNDMDQAYDDAMFVKHVGDTVVHVMGQPTAK